MGPTAEVFSAPEIKRSGSSFKSDMYSLGMCLYYMMTFDFLDLVQVKLKEFKFTNPYSQELKDIAMKLLEFNPGDRLTIEQLLNHPLI